MKRAILGDKRKIENLIIQHQKCFTILTYEIYLPKNVLAKNKTTFIIMRVTYTHFLMVRPIS